MAVKRHHLLQRFTIRKAPFACSLPYVMPTFDPEPSIERTEIQLMKGVMLDGLHSINEAGAI